MRLAPIVVVLALFALPLAGCGPQIPPMGTYATVSGQVLDAATNNPIAGATVIINSTLNATTDSNGAFRIYPVPSGPWEYYATAPNYQPIQTITNAPPLAAGEQRGLTIQLTRA